MLQVSRTGKIKSWLAKGDKWIPAAYFLCVLALYLTTLGNFVFVDELDVFYGGYNIVKSGDLYGFYLSQHMPFSYYIAAFGALIGARSAWHFRLYFFVLLSGLWTGIYIRNRKVFPRLALLVMPLLYIIQLYMQYLGTSMVSDHWQGIGLLVILLELVRFAEEREISVGMACMIALGIALSFGTTFLSAYPLLILFLGVLVIQAVMIFKKERKFSEILKEDLRLALICLSPFLVLLLWYAVSGNLANAYGGAYDLNVNVYSNYLKGFGSSPGGTFVAAFPNWIRYQGKSIEFLRSGDWRWALQIWLQTASLILFVISLCKNKKIIAGITFLLAVILAGVRAFDGFHGAPYMAVVCIPMGLCLDATLSFFLEKRSWRRAAPAALALALTIALVLPGAGIVRNWVHVPQLIAGRHYRDSNRNVLEVLAEPGERVHTDDLYYSALTVMESGLCLDKASMCAGNPWFWEYYGEEKLNALKENQTRIIVMDLEGKVWEQGLRDYAPEMVDYVEANYTNIGPNLYVRNEDLPQAVEKLRAAGYGTMYAMPNKEVESALGPEMENGAVYEQRFTAAGSWMTAVQVRIATYLDQNRAGVKVRLLDSTGEVIGESALPKDELRDNVYSRFALHAETKPGAQYTLQIMTDGEGPEETPLQLAMYVYPAAGGGAFLNGEQQAFDWAVATEYEAE